MAGHGQLDEVRAGRERRQPLAARRSRGGGRRENHRRGRGCRRTSVREWGSTSARRVAPAPAHPDRSEQGEDRHAPRGPSGDRSHADRVPATRHGHQSGRGGALEASRPGWRHWQRGCPADANTASSTAEPRRRQGTGEHHRPRTERPPSLVEGDDRGLGRRVVIDERRCHRGADPATAPKDRETAKRHQECEVSCAPLVA